MPLRLSDKDIINSELIREIVRMRIDTAWRMLHLEAHNQLPPIDSEKSTGDLDDKGALFLPGPFIFADSERIHINPATPDKPMSIQDFREDIRAAMKHDNATLLFPRSVVYGVNLDNSFFLELSRNIVHSQTAARKRTLTLADQPPIATRSDDITKSYCPPYFPGPYGSRTKLSCALSVCVNQPHLYFIQANQHFSFRESEREKYWDAIRSIIREPMISYNGMLLAHPCVVTCHNTRYKEEAFSGITRISGYGKFGEFATITIEKLTNALFSELGRTKSSILVDEIVASKGESHLVCILRTYPATTPGKRLRKGTSVKILHPEKDLRINVAHIEEAAKVRYFK